MVIELPNSIQCLTGLEISTSYMQLEILESTRHNRRCTIQVHLLPWYKYGLNKQPSTNYNNIMLHLCESLYPNNVKIEVQQ